MDAAGEVSRLLDDLIDRLEGAGAVPKEAAGDAIDAVLAGPRRTSEVRSLRDDPAVARFRRELVDGLIRADTAGRLLELMVRVIDRVLPLR